MLKKRAPHRAVNATEVAVYIFEVGAAATEYKGRLPSEFVIELGAKRLALIRRGPHRVIVAVVDAIEVA